MLAQNVEFSCRKKIEFGHRLGIIKVIAELPLSQLF